jgi:hypothetical protein
LASKRFKFVWLPTFERTSRKLLSKDDRRATEVLLCEDPSRVISCRGPAGSESYVFPWGGKRTSFGLSLDSCCRISHDIASPADVRRAADSSRA